MSPLQMKVLLPILVVATPSHAEAAGSRAIMQVLISNPITMIPYITISSSIVIALAW